MTERGLDWPPGFERTPPIERSETSRFQASLATTTQDLETELERLDPDDWRASMGNQHTKANGLPRHDANPEDPGFVLHWRKDNQQFAVACDAYADLRDNVRAVYLWVHETRMRGQRPVVTGDSEFAAARLPSGDEHAESAVTHAPPHEILNVAPDAPDDIVRAAARRLAADVHPDTEGGDPEQFKRIQEAKEAMLDG